MAANLDIANIVITIVIFGFVFWLIGFLATRISFLPGWVFTLLQALLGLALIIWIIRLIAGIAGWGGTTKIGMLTPFIG